MIETDFKKLPLPKSMLANLDKIGYEKMTPIQAQSIPYILKSRDVIAQAKTGSGKTAAFGLGLLSKIDVSVSRVQALVLCPTRELADQVSKEIRKLGKGIPNLKVLTLCGGTPIRPQVASLEHGAHVIVATPGRLDDHLRKSSLRLNHLRTLVLDEADRMLEFGFQKILESIFIQTTQTRQTLLYSATFPSAMEALVDNFMVDPVKVFVEDEKVNSNISQEIYEIENDEQRKLVLQLLIKEKQPESTLVFCTTKIQTDELANELIYRGFNAAALNGDLSQVSREQTLVRFANKSTAVLVATDVAARGLDIESLDMVVNYYLPLDPEVYVHRIGRTGRAGRSGRAITLYSSKEVKKVRAVEDYQELKLEKNPLPDEKWLDEPSPKSPMATIRIGGGKKQKVRAGDILGALTRNKNIEGKQVGKVHLFDNVAFVAVEKAVAEQAFKNLSAGKLKGRKFKVDLLNR